MSLRDYENLVDLYDAARAVCDNWEGNDLAMHVQHLQETLDEIAADWEAEDNEDAS